MDFTPLYTANSSKPMEFGVKPHNSIPLARNAVQFDFNPCKHPHHEKVKVEDRYRRVRQSPRTSHGRDKSDNVQPGTLFTSKLRINNSGFNRIVADFNYSLLQLVGVRKRPPAPSIGAGSLRT